MMKNCKNLEFYVLPVGIFKEVYPCVVYIITPDVKALFHA